MQADDRYTNRIGSGWDSFADKHCPECDASLRAEPLADHERKLLIHGAEEEDLVNSGLEETMSVAWHQIRDAQRKHPKTDLRTAAFISAIDKIAVSYLELGIFP